MEPRISLPSEGEPITSVGLNEAEKSDMSKCRFKAVMKNPWGSGQLCQMHYNRVDDQRTPHAGIGVKHWMTMEDYKKDPRGWSNNRYKNMSEDTIGQPDE